MVLYLKDFIHYNSFKDPYAVSWEVALDDKFTDLIAYSYMDTKNIYMIRLSTANIDFNYKKNKNFYARCKLHYRADNNRIVDSDWYVLELNDYNTIVRDLAYKGFTVGVSLEHSDKTEDLYFI